MQLTQTHVDETVIAEIASGARMVTPFQYQRLLAPARGRPRAMSQIAATFKKRLEGAPQDADVLGHYVATLITLAEDVGGLDGRAPAGEARALLGRMADRFGASARVSHLEGTWHRDIHRLASPDIDRRKSIEHLRRAVDLSGGDEFFRLELGKALAKVGERAQAGAHLAETIRIARDASVRAEAEKWHAHVRTPPRLELRVHRPGDVERALALGADVVSLGSDACPLSLPPVPELREARRRAADAGRELKLVTPAVFQRHWERFNAYLDAVLAEMPELGIVFNDYGVLERVARRHPEYGQITLGHVLSYIYEECPWFDYLVEAEGEWIARTEEVTVFDTPGNLEFLKRYRVKEIETCMLPMAVTSFHGFWDRGYAVNAMVDMIPFTYGRACHGARYYGKTVGKDCFEICNEITTLRYSHRWIFQERHLHPVKDRTMERIGPMHSYGNVLFAKTNFVGSAEDVGKTDVLTIDVRHYADARLREVIAQYRDLAGQRVPASA